MTRDFELIREILLQVENSPAGEPVQFLTVTKPVDDATLGRHLEILIDAGLIEGEVLAYNPVSFFIRGLTWTGHEFIEHARNESIWNSVLNHARATGTSVSLEILKGLLAQAAAKLAGLN